MNFKNWNDQVQLIATDLCSKTRPLITAKLLQMRPFLETKTKEELCLVLPSWKGGLWKQSRIFENWLAEYLERELADIAQDQKPYFYESLQEAVSRLERIANDFLLKLTVNVEAILGVSLKKTHFAINLKPSDFPDISRVRTFDIPFDILLFWIPVKVFRPLVRRHFLNLIPFEVEKNISRLSSQWTDVINGRIMEMQVEIESFIQGELSMVESALSRKGSESNEISQYLKQLQ